MTSSRSSHRAEFTVRCECGNEFHTDDTHAGKSLRCRCGRTVVLARPRDEYIAPEASAKKSSSSSSQSSSGTKRRRRVVTDETIVIPVKHRTVQWADQLRNIPGNASVAAVNAIRQLNDRRPVVRWTVRASWGYVLLMIITWLLLITTSERFLPATLLAYGPRFVVLLPLVALVPMALFVSRAALFPLLFAAWIGVHSIMGFRVSLNTLISRDLPAAPATGSIRVISYNVLQGGRLAFDLPIVVRELAPDILAFQECGPRLWTAMQALPGWYAKQHAQMCTASRWPIVAVDSMMREDLLRVSQYGAGGTGAALRLTLNTPYGRLQLVNVHLETVRKGLESLVGSEGFIPDQPASERGADYRAPTLNENKIAINSLVRSFESARASKWAAVGTGNDPMIVAGDFNLPVESSIFRQSWGAFTDAFESAGTGFGYTKRDGWLQHARIDHVLVMNGLQPKWAGIGPDYDSDHLPVIADLAWPKRK